MKSDVYGAKVRKRKDILGRLRLKIIQNLIQNLSRIREGLARRPEGESQLENETGREMGV